MVSIAADDHFSVVAIGLSLAQYSTPIIGPVRQSTIARALIEMISGSPLMESLGSKLRIWSMTNARDKSGQFEPHEGLYGKVRCDVERLERQLLFVVQLWSDRDENYERIAAAVRAGAEKLRTEAKSINQARDRQDMLEKIERVISHISHLNRYPPYVPGSAGQRPASPRGRIGSIKPGGLPGFGKRR